LEEGLTAATAHCCWWARNANPNGQFAAAMRQWSEMTDDALAAALRHKNYDGLLYIADHEVIGHLFFQRHDSELHGFAVWVAEPYREKKWPTTFSLPTTFTLDFIAYASQCPDIERARIGAGDSLLTYRLLAPLMPSLTELGWRTTGGGWVDFERRESQNST